MIKRKSNIKRKPILLLFFLMLLIVTFIYYNNRKENRKIDISSLTKLPIPDGFSVLGIDVSHHNGKINWEAVKAQGVAFAYIKATEGSSHLDKHYKFNYDKAKECGIKVGFYHFFIFRSDGIKQAKYFLKKLSYESGDLPPVIDVEYSPCNVRSTVRQVVNDRVIRLKQFDSIVYRELKMHPVIYTNKECYEDLIRDNFPENDLWLCDLIQEPNDDEYPNWIMWQHSHRGSVVGISTKVDMDVFYADKNEFDTWIE